MKKQQQPKLIYAVNLAPQRVAALAELLARYSIGVRSHSGGPRFVQMLRRSKARPACVLLACDLSNNGDCRILQHLATISPPPPIFVLSDATDQNVQRKAAELGATDIIENSMHTHFIAHRLLDVLGEHSPIDALQPEIISLADNDRITIRSLRCDDAGLVQAFAAKQARLNRSAPNRIIFDRSLATLLETSVLEDETSLRALVATSRSFGKEVVIGMARFGQAEKNGTARFAIMTAEGWQRKGIGSQLLRSLIPTAALAGVQRLESEISTRNRPMVGLAQQLGFELDSKDTGDLVKVSKSLRRGRMPERSNEDGTGASVRSAIRRASSIARDAGRRMQLKLKAAWSTLTTFISSRASLALLFFLMSLPVLLLPAAAVAQSAEEQAVVTAEPLPVASEDTPADSDIRRRIAATYAQIGALDAVSVRVQDGVVLLTGQVSNEVDANRALELAGKFEGVIAVDDGIERSLDIEGNVVPLINKLKASAAGWMQAAPLLLLAFLIFATIGFAGHQLAGWSSLWRRLSPNPFLGELLAQAVRITFIVIGLILALNLIGATALIGTILGGAGMLGLAIGFAVRDTLENYISSIMLSVRQPFRANDHVVIQGNEGRVVRLTSRATVLMTLDGNQLRIPNSMVFKAVILNYTRNPERRFDFELGIDADDDPVQAMSVGLEAMGALDFVLAQPEANAIIKSVGDSNIVVQFMAWVDQSASDFGKSRSLAIRVVKTVLEEQGFTLPEPIYRLRFDSNAIEKQVTASVHKAGDEPQQRAKSKAPKVVTGDAQDVLDVTPDKHLESMVSDERASDAGDDLLDASRPVE